MPVRDADILTSLPLLRWGGLDAPPYDVLDVSWDNGLAERRIPYVDGAVHDNVGRGSFPLTARLYFLNTVGPPPAGYSRYFPDYWNAWQRTLLDGEPRDLQHPVLGTLRARVRGGKYIVQASCRSGIVVDVTWVETVEDPSSLNLNGYTNVTLPSEALATAADAAVAPFGVVFGAGRPPQSLTLQYGVSFSPGQVVTTISAVLTAIRPALFAANRKSAQLLAALMGDVAAMNDAIAAEASVFTYAAADALTAFYLACDNMRRGLAASARPTGTLITTAPDTLDAIAGRTGNSLKDIMGLNLTLLRAPRIEKGTAVKFYVAA